MRGLAVLILIAAMAVIVTGCASVSAPYVMNTDRVDQKLDQGNRGYLKGTPPPPPDRGDLKRPWIAVDVDLLETSSKSTAPAKEEKPVEVKREVTVVKEETPTTVKKTTVVKEEEIK
jgi:hypothetical protein